MRIGILGLQHESNTFIATPTTLDMFRQGGLLTGDAIDGVEAARMGFANRAYPLEELEESVLALAERIAKVPMDLQQLNKRSVHRALEVMGMRTAVRAGTEIQAMGFHQRSSKDYFKQFMQGVTQALDQRDEKFGDYRTKDKDEV